MPWWGTLLQVHMVKQRCFVAEEVITEALPQHQSLIFLYRVGEGFLGEDWEVICFFWEPFLIVSYSQAVV